MRNGAPVSLQRLVGVTGRANKRFSQDADGQVYISSRQDEDGVIEKIGVAEV